MTARTVGSPATRDLTWPQRGEARHRVETTAPRGPTDTHQATDSHGRTGPGPPDAPQSKARDRPTPTKVALYGSAPRTVPAGPDVSLGSLGWLAVLLVAALLMVLAHAASMHPGHAEHREPPPPTNPAQALAQ